jgi:hypothetical protein
MGFLLQDLGRNAAAAAAATKCADSLRALWEEVVVASMHYLIALLGYSVCLR